MSFMKNPPPTVPHFLRAWRKNARLTQEQVANIIGISNNTLSDKELGKRPVDTEELKKLAEIYKCEPWMLLAAPPNSEKLAHLVRATGLIDDLTEKQIEAWLSVGETFKSAA